MLGCQSPPKTRWKSAKLAIWTGRLTGPRRQRPTNAVFAVGDLRDGLFGTGVFVNLYAGQSFRHRTLPRVCGRLSQGHCTGPAGLCCRTPLIDIHVMRMNTDTGRWQLGFTMSLTTAVLWGFLPIALKVALTGMDVYTITWWRFAVSMLALGAFLAWRGQLPRLRGAGRERMRDSRHRAR